MKKLLAILCALAVLVSLAACSSSKSKDEKSGGSYKDAVTTYEKLMNGDIKQIKNLLPPEIIDLYEEESGDSIEAYMDELEESYADFIEEAEYDYGDNVKFTISIAEKTECDEDRIEQIQVALEDEYDIEFDVKAAYEVVLEMTTKGSEDSDTDEEEAFILQLGKNWYLCNYYEYDGELYVYFFF